MSLKIAKNQGLTDIVSAGDGSNAISTQHPIAGSSQEVRLWLFNDNAAERFENISIDPTDTEGSDESTWMQLAPDSGGVAGMYLAGGAALSIANIADNGVGKPFWLKVTTPAVGNVQNKSDIKLTVNYRKFAV
ncbi:hypothetical protein [Cytobacillus purgationiresistens]|uniref:Uncharacterized protein n=1 Tax=Cytobacillus purgationiresistens TaxID=863449 RepID=A0ABU0AKZ0_9BACI|nr:hypothetical protein [Cytobacillus purgationiresistens]MDQ0270710.1 hypothetical protein [Cytobacillus purgationiresistens]